MFYLFNTHFDHRGEEARTQSARLLLEKINALAGDALVSYGGRVNEEQDKLAFYYKQTVAYKPAVLYA